ncbi:MAG: GGDEF domain-containing protein [Cellvibrionaceae bacterium]|nr:GGDEF domain-containing protein [Cellvibrionaceae bacterium]
MKSDLYSALRICAGITTILVALFHDYLPQKSLILYPNQDVAHVLFGSIIDTDEIATSWIDEKQEEWRCQFKSKENFFCGYSLYFPSAIRDFANGIDLSSYAGINIELDYTGPAQRIRLFLRNYSPHYAQNGTWDSMKFMSINAKASDFGKNAYFSLSEFGVADWWILEKDVDRRHAAPEFNKIVTFGIDFVSPGNHEVSVKKVEVVGQWIATEQLYLGLLIFWMALIIWEGSSRIYKLYMRSRKSDQIIGNLLTNYNRLEIEKKEYEALSTTDMLTGVMNRTGINLFVQKLFDSNFSKEHIGIMLFDIDHFKRVNDELGHDTGDQVLQKVAGIIADNIRHTDVFGRWGGEEFILVCPQTEEQDLKALAEKIVPPRPGHLIQYRRIDQGHHERRRHHS